jgi:hypothetical protein
MFSHIIFALAILDGFILSGISYYYGDILFTIMGIVGAITLIIVKVILEIEFKKYEKYLRN